MSNQDRHQDQRQPAPTQRPQRGNGRSGRGADSALKQLREWEQRRAAGTAQPERDRPE